MSDRLLTPGEVAALFRVDPKTVSRWANDGRLPYVRTLGGHRRYPESAVRRLMLASRAGPGATMDGSHPAHHMRRSTT